MININLRPWRDELRKEKQQQYVAILVLCVLVGFGIAYLWKMQVGAQITVQQARNTFLENEAQPLDRKITEIQTLRQERQALIDRMEVIQSLQTDRPTTVYLFDSLARLIPSDVFLSGMSKSGTRVSLNGIGKTNISVTDFMRALDESPYFDSPRISGFSSVDFDERTGSSGYTFTIDVNQVNPGAEAEEDE